jgi:hypothetical protein
MASRCHARKDWSPAALPWVAVALAPAAAADREHGSITDSNRARLAAQKPGLARVLLLSCERVMHPQKVLL